MKKLFILLLIPIVLFNCSDDNSSDVNPPEATCDNGTFVGIVRLKTQVEVDEFAAMCYTKVDGVLRIGPDEGVESDISDLSGLASINEVLLSQSEEGTGKLIILNTTNLLNLNGLQNITKTPGIIIVNNSGLNDLTGLEGITSLTSSGPFNDLVINDNSQLQNLNGLQNLTAIGSENSDESTTIFMQIQGNESLINCLLYTSPSPRDKRQSRMPSSA